jgi:DNA replication protein
MNVLKNIVDFKYLLIEYYKDLGFDETHLAILLMIDHLIVQKNYFITAEHLTIKMKLSMDEIDKKLVDLLEKKMIEYVSVGGETRTSIEPIKILLFKKFQQSVIQAQQSPSQESMHIYQSIEKAFGRTLSPLEVSMIRDWLAFGYDEKLILSCVQEAVSKHKFSIRVIDKILQKNTIKDNFEQESNLGASGQNKNIRSEIEKIKAEISNDRNK